MKLLLFCVCFVIFLCVANARPKIVDEILPEVKRFGQTAYLNCTVVDKENYALVWTHQTSGNIISKDTQIYMEINPEEAGLKKYEVVREFRSDGNFNRITYMLIIRFLRLEDAGEYKCYVLIPDSTSQPYRIGQLNLQSPPKIIRSQTTSIATVQQGADFNLTCVSSGHPAPNITWFRADGKPLPIGVSQFRGSVLALKNIAAEDRGAYACIADNFVVPSDRFDANLLVSFKPTVKAIQDSVGQAPNRQYDSTLECEVIGYPSPSLRWYRLTNNGEEVLTDNDRYDINMLKYDEKFITKTMYSLKIKNVQALDYTDYYCDGRNDYGTSRAVIKLFYTTECQGYNCQSISVGSHADRLLPSAVMLMMIAIVTRHLTW